MKPLATVLLLASFVAAARAQTPSPTVLRADLDTLAVSLPRMHPAAFKNLTEAEWQSSINNLKAAADTISRDAYILGIATLVARIGDGHTTFGLPAEIQTYLPLRLRYFDEGLFIIGAPASLAVNGQRLVAIGGISVDTLARRLQKFIARDNSQEYKYSAPDLLISVPYLKAIGVRFDSSAVKLSVQRGSTTSTATVTAASWDDWWELAWRGVTPFTKDSTRLSLNYLMATASTLPHVQRGERYWLEVDSSKVGYFHYSDASNQKNRPTVEALTDSLLAAIDKGEIRHLIVDLRQNPGGEPKLLRRLIDGIKSRPAFNRTGSIAVLAGRRTFSAATTNFAELMQETAAKSFGEAPRGRPNNASEGRTLKLPGTGLRLLVSTQRVERWPALGDRPMFPIDYPQPDRFADYVRGRDVALEAATNWLLHGASPIRKQ